MKGKSLIISKLKENKKLFLDHHQVIKEEKKDNHIFCVRVATLQDSINICTLKTGM